jgi:hypothetical protein
LIQEVLTFVCLFFVGLQDRRTNPSYSRRASLVYTPAPAKKVGGASLLSLLGCVDLLR